jgi:hypothetical protein
MTQGTSMHAHTYSHLKQYLVLFLCCFFFPMGVGFELSALHLQSSTTFVKLCLTKKKLCQGPPG